MNKTQEEKFAAWKKDFEVHHSPDWNSARLGYETCLESNGIGEEPRIPEGSSSAPEWVIDMMRTGKPVRCKVWDDDEKTSETAMINCYCMCNGGGEFRYSDVMGEPWKNAAPIPAWSPKDGEAVLVEFAETNITVYAIAASDHEIYSWDKVTGEKRIVSLPMKPFDVSNLGKPWSEI